MFRLPVSGKEVELSSPAGWHELVVLEERSSDAEAAVALVESQARIGGHSRDAAHLSVTDLEALLLRIGQAMLGDSIRSEVRCPARSCGVSVDVDFHIGEYLAQHAVRSPRGIRKGSERGWFRIEGQR